MTEHKNVLTLARQAVPVGAKWAFTTRRVRHDDAVMISNRLDHAVSGDLMLCRVKAIGQHKRIQLAQGRYSELYENDLIVLCAGDRYAPDQFEGVADFSDMSAELLAAGGVAGRMLARHDRMSLPTRLEVLGLLMDQSQQVINIADYALPHQRVPNDLVVIGVLGTSMNAGKTTAAVSLAKGLSRAGFRTVGMKITGTGAFGDYNAFLDAGVPTLDFTDAGMATTYLQPIERIEDSFDRLMGEAGRRGAQVVVVEIADGIMQPETAAILEGSRIKDRMAAILFAAGDALGAIGAVQQLETYGLRPFAISGVLSQSPLAMREVQNICDIRCLSRANLCDPNCVSQVLAKHLPAQCNNLDVIAA